MIRQKNRDRREGNLFANKSALILRWLLFFGLGARELTLREVAREVGVSLGLVHKVFDGLVQHGILEIRGLRTNKRFLLSKPKRLLDMWTEKYEIMRNCRIWTYTSGLDRAACISKLEATFSSSVTWALHSAAEKLGAKNTNLQKLEMYITDPAALGKIERELELEPTERGYDVLLIEPYYKRLLREGKKTVVCSDPLLTYLDLYHFPLRGIEQAEYLARSVPQLQKILGRK